MEDKAAQTSASWLSGGLSQHQVVLQAAPSFGQPRLISRLGRISAGRPYRLVSHIGGHPLLPVTVRDGHYGLARACLNLSKPGVAAQEGDGAVLAWLGLGLGSGSGLGLGSGLELEVRRSTSSWGASTAACSAVARGWGLGERSEE